MKTKTRIAGLTLAIIGLLVLTGCLRPLSSKQSSNGASAAATIAAAEATQAAAQATKAAAVQVIAQATQNAQRPAPTTVGRTPTPIVMATSAPKVTSPTPASGSAGTWTVRGEDVFGNATVQQFPVGQGPAGPVPMPPGMGNLPLIAQMVGGSGASGSTPTAAPTPTPVVLDTSTAVQMHYGDMITQTIKSSGDVGLYAFDGKAGDIAFIVAAGTADASWLELQVKLYDPQGKPVVAGSGGHDEYKLPADGRYVFTVRDAGTQIGPYNVLLKNASPGKGVRVTYGAKIGTEIAVPGDVHFYSFFGKAGDVVRIALTARGRGEWLVHLLDPQRGYLGLNRSSSTNSTGIIERALIADGEYTIRIYATGILDSPTTGPYALLVKNVAGAAGTRLAYGDVVTGTIAPEGDKDVYVFEWKPGEKVSIEAKRGAGRGNYFYPQIEIFDVKGNSLARGATSDAQPLIQLKPPLSEAGLYIVTVEGKLHVNWDTGDYTLSLKNLAAP